MGNYSVPENIRKMKPKGSAVKLISGHYYVYAQKHVKDADTGKWKIKIGNYLGKIDPVLGFVSCGKSLSFDRPSVYEFGQYAVPYLVGKNTHSLLDECFGAEDGTRIFILALIHYVNGFTYIRHTDNRFQDSFLSLLYPTFRYGKDALSSLYKDLGRKTGKTDDFEEKCYALTKTMAVDGHSILSDSDYSCLSRKGNKYQKYKSEQVNLIMGYDIETGRPVFSDFVPGDAVDSVSMNAILKRRKFSGVLFLVDKGFYSAENLEMFTRNGCHYIMPVPETFKVFRDNHRNLGFAGEHFIYSTHSSRTVIYYETLTAGNGRKYYAYRDLTEYTLECDDYLKKVEKGISGYTMEHFEELKDGFGTAYLMTDAGYTPEEIYKNYKKRWNIETYYDYVKNQLGFQELCCQDYYIQQGMAFILLVTSLIHSDMASYFRNAGGNTLDVLEDASLVKIRLDSNVWNYSVVPRKRISNYEKWGVDLSSLLALVNNAYTASHTAGKSQNTGSD